MSRLRHDDVRVVLGIVRYPADEETTELAHNLRALIARELGDDFEVTFRVDQGIVVRCKFHTAREGAGSVRAAGDVCTTIAVALERIARPRDANYVRWIDAMLGAITVKTHWID